MNKLQRDPRPAAPLIDAVTLRAKYGALRRLARCPKVAFPGTPLLIHWVKWFF